MKRPESVAERLWRYVRKYDLAFQRYRGVVLVVSIPVLLVAAIVLLVPRSSPLLYEKTHSLAELRHKNGATAGIAAASGARYAVVLDAGSTGSRVHVFKFEQVANKPGELKLISDTFEQLKPGLSAFPDDPESAAASLKPLLDTALKTVPVEQQKITPVSLKATAGLRLLPGDKADKILEAVTLALRKLPFSLAPDAVSILGGQDEGGFAWLTLNYLLGKVGGSIEDTVAGIDLGGGSVQEAFALSDKEAQAAPKGYVTKLKAAGKVYNVYVHSYLGYGLMAARAKLIQAAAAAAAAGHPCFAKGLKLSYKYAGSEYFVNASSADGKYESCAIIGKTALAIDQDCGAVKDECSFNGAWRGKHAKVNRQYYISSYFWDRAQDSGIITDPKAAHFETNPQEFAQKAAAVCTLDGSASVLKAFPGVKPDQAPFFCLDLSFCHTLLTKGFGLSDTSRVTLVKQILYNGHLIEAAWPLGAAINDLSP